VNIFLALIMAAGIALLSGQAVTPPGQTAASNVAASPAGDIPREAPAKPVILTHKVAAGENLSVIARNYGVDVDTLLGANPDAGHLIQPGDELVILPNKGILHAVEKGESLWGIARTYGVSVETIVAANGKQDEFLAEGEKLFVPGARSMQVSRSSAARFIWPSAGELTSYYGYRWGRLHAGIDIADDVGAVVRAAKTGRVAFAGWWGGYGYTVVLEHGQGYTSLYGHLSDYAVAVGQHVAAGQTIGYVGNTGNSTGPHLHFEIRKDGQSLNPLTLLP
jgi:LysM repeat protein